jgi:hypothetical protein
MVLWFVRYEDVKGMKLEEREKLTRRAQNEVM